MKKYLLGAILVSTILFTGCGDVQPTLTTAVEKSFDVEIGMKKAQVQKLLVIKPTNKQRLNDQEIWKYEGNVVNEDTLDAKYNNIIIKFKDGVVSNIGSFSCDLPKVVED